MKSLKKIYKTLAMKNETLFAMNFYNLETLQGLLKAAAAKKRSIILQVSPSSLDYMGAKVIAPLVKASAEEFDVNVWLHLDHAKKLETVKTALGNGFDSIMIDGSELDIEENIHLTKEAVALASWKDVPVEAELGYVAKLGQTQEPGKGFTNPDEAKRFVSETGVDALAIAIGTAHGFYKETPKLDFELLRKIRKIIPNTVLVLHGSSGLPDNDLIEAMNSGINKINVATEFKDAFMTSLKRGICNTDEIDIRKIFPVAIEEVYGVAKQKLDLLEK